MAKRKIVRVRLLSPPQAKVYRELREIGVSPSEADKWVRKRITIKGRIIRVRRKKKVIRVRKKR